MAEEANENLDSTNETTEEVEKTEEVEETVADTETEDIEAIKEKNVRLFERAKKAEAEAKLLRAERLKSEEQAKVKTDSKPVAPTEKQVGLTAMDTIALIGAKITEKDDVDFVADYAQFKKISVGEALKSGVVKSELAQRLEQRATAEATNTGPARRGSVKLSNEQILNDVYKGKYPEDPEVLAEARMNAKK